MSKISELAYICSGAKIGRDVIIEPFAFIDEDVEIGSGTHIMSNANIRRGARIGKRCTIFPGAVVSGVPQDLKFNNEETFAFIGNDVVIRECATVNRGTFSRGETVVGNSCLLMAYSHVAHDCILKENIIVGNATQIAGEVEVDDFAILSGGALIHQFSKIGCHTMIQGGCKVTKDVPPYGMVGREPASYVGINIVGLKRRGFTREQINTIQDIYRLVYQSGLNVSQALLQVEDEIHDSEEKFEILNFIKSSQRGIVRGSLEG